MCINPQKQPLELFYKKSVLKNIAIFTGKHLCQNLFLNKVTSLRLLLKKRLWHRCFPVNFGKFFRTTFLKNTSGRLLLNPIFPHQLFCKSIDEIICCWKGNDYSRRTLEQPTSMIDSLEQKLYFQICFYRSSHLRCSLKKSCFEKFCNIHRKTLVLEPLF